jgi:hypothetical protein
LRSRTCYYNPKLIIPTGDNMETNAIISELSAILAKIKEEEVGANKKSSLSISPGLRFASTIIESRILDLKIEESTLRDSPPANVDSNIYGSSPVTVK